MNGAPVDAPLVLRVHPEVASDLTRDMQQTPETQAAACTVISEPCPYSGFVRLEIRGDPAARLAARRTVMNDLLPRRMPDEHDRRGYSWAESGEAPDPERGPAVALRRLMFVPADWAAATFGQEEFDKAEGVLKIEADTGTALRLASGTSALRDGTVPVLVQPKDPPGTAEGVTRACDMFQALLAEGAEAYAAEEAPARRVVYTEEDAPPEPRTEFELPHSLVGCLLGKSHSNRKRIESEAGVRVWVENPNPRGVQRVRLQPGQGRGDVRLAWSMVQALLWRPFADRLGALVEQSAGRLGARVAERTSEISEAVHAVINELGYVAAWEALNDEQLGPLLRRTGVVASWEDLLLHRLRGLLGLDLNGQPKPMPRWMALAWEELRAEVERHPHMRKLEPRDQVLVAQKLEDMSDVRALAVLLNVVKEVERLDPQDRRARLEHVLGDCVTKYRSLHKETELLMLRRARHLLGLPADDDAPPDAGARARDAGPPRRDARARSPERSPRRRASPPRRRSPEPRRRSPEPRRWTPPPHKRSPQSRHGSPPPPSGRSPARKRGASPHKEPAKVARARSRSPPRPARQAGAEDKGARESKRKAHGAKQPGEASPATLEAHVARGESVTCVERSDGPHAGGAGAAQVPGGIIEGLTRHERWVMERERGAWKGVLALEDGGSMLARNLKEVKKSMRLARAFARRGASGDLSGALAALSSALVVLTDEAEVVHLDGSGVTEKDVEELEGMRADVDGWS
ncbi:unnamed protein product [Pedinophyceae sp. YPF-701]|nr:unnamed protein product [Pedinophyceae sp. YPF-701]